MSTLQSGMQEHFQKMIDDATLDELYPSSKLEPSGRSKPLDNSSALWAETSERVINLTKELVTQLESKGLYPGQGWPFASLKMVFVCSGTMFQFIVKSLLILILQNL